MKKYAILFLLFSVQNFTAQASKLLNQSDSLSHVEPQTIKSENLKELDYYKMLYENSEQKTDSLTSLIQWSFGISLGFLLAIIGSQIFFNYRINKRELDYIKKDIDEKVLELENKLIAKNQEKFDGIEDSIKKSIHELKTENKDYLQNEFNNSEKLKEAKYEILKNKLTNKVEKIEDKIDTSIIGLRKDVLKNEGEIWKLRGINANALSSFQKVAFIKFELEENIDFILDDILRVLNEMEEIHELELASWTTLYDKIKEKYKDKANRINDLFTSKDVYTFVKSNIETNIGAYGLAKSKKVVSSRSNKKE